jgi:hypothetical protein
MKQLVTGSASSSNYSTDAQGSSTAEVKTYCSFSGQPRNPILLATAGVEVKNKSGQYVPCRSLLDSAAQSHFITERCVQRLRLPMTQTHASIQGISHVNTAAHHSVSVHLRSRHSDWHSNGNPFNLGLFASLQSDDYMQLNAGWREIQNSRFSTTTS